MVAEYDYTVKPGEGIISIDPYDVFIAAASEVSLAHERLIQGEYDRLADLFTYRSQPRNRTDKIAPLWKIRLLRVIVRKRCGSAVHKIRPYTILQKVCDISRGHTHTGLPVLNGAKRNVIPFGKFTLGIAQTISHFTNIHLNHLTPL